MPGSLCLAAFPPSRRASYIFVGPRSHSVGSAPVLGVQHGEKRAEPVPGLGRSCGLGVLRTLKCSRWVNSTPLGGS